MILKNLKIILIFYVAPGALYGGVELDLLKRCLVEKDFAKGKALFEQVQPDFYFKRLLRPIFEPSLSKSEATAQMIKMSDDFGFNRANCTKDPESFEFGGENDSHRYWMSFNQVRVKSLVLDPRAPLLIKQEFQNGKWDNFWLIWIFDKKSQECLFEHLNLVFLQTQILRIFKVQTQWIFEPWWVPEDAKQRYALLLKELSVFDKPEKLNSAEFQREHAELLRLFHFSEEKERLEFELAQILEANWAIKLEILQRLEIARKIQSKHIFDPNRWLNLGKMKGGFSGTVKSRATSNETLDKSGNFSFFARAFNSILRVFNSISGPSFLRASAMTSLMDLD